MADPAPLNPAQSDRTAVSSDDAHATLSRRCARRLGPRSLSPPLFLERCVRAYSRPGATCRLLQLLTTYGHEPGLSFPRRDEGLDLLPFLTPHARPSELPPKSGETRRAAHASDRQGPGAGSSCLRRFARPRYRVESRHVRPPLTCVTGGRLDGGDVHGFLDRAKDVSSRSGAACALRFECVRLTHADDVPLLRLPEDTRCRRCARLQRKRPAVGEVRTDQGPRCSGFPRRKPASRGPGCLPPLRRDLRERISLCDFRVGLSLTPPTLCPQTGESALDGHCKHR